MSRRRRSHWSWPGRSHDRISASGRRRCSLGARHHPQGPAAGFDRRAAPRQRRVGRAARRLGRSRRRSSAGPGSSRSGTTTTRSTDSSTVTRWPRSSRRAGSVRLAPLRAFGTWPGLPRDIPKRRHVEHEGPVAVLTLGRPRASQPIRFLRTSAKAENSAVVAPGLTWATGSPGRSRSCATCSLWESTRAAVDLRVRHEGARASRRDRERRGEAVPPRAGVHPLPPLRRARPARRQEPPRAGD